MTQHKDLKRLVRERQARTGESYMTALRHIRGERPPAILVEEMVDLSEVAASLGLTCRVVIQHGLAGRVDTAAVLRQLHRTLRETVRDPAFDLMRAVVLYGDHAHPLRYSLTDRAFVDRVRAGIGGVNADGRILAFTVAGRDQPEMAMFYLWTLPPIGVPRRATLIVSSPRGMFSDIPQLERVRGVLP
jgi:hypothetical protein